MTKTQRLEFWHTLLYPTTYVVWISHGYSYNWLERPDPDPNPVPIAPCDLGIVHVQCA